MTFGIHPLAQSEIQDAGSWYEEQRAGLGFEFLAAIESAIATVLAQPERNPPAGGNVRFLRMKRFPYHLYFRFHPDQAHVHFVALLHSKRRPGLWKIRP